MTTRFQREIWAAEAHGRELAKAECAERIRQAGLTTSFNMNVIVTIRNPDQLLGMTAIENEIVTLLARYQRENLITRYQFSMTQVIAGAN